MRLYERYAVFYAKVSILDLDLNSNKAIILFGGSFDPVHLGHLHFANLIAAATNSEVYLMPCPQPNSAKEPVAIDHRLAMLKLAINNHSALKITEIELNINSKIKTSTVNTLKNIRKHCGNDRKICFCLGFDSLYSIDKWYNWQQILNFCNIIVVNRNSLQLKGLNPQIWHHIKTKIVVSYDKMIAPFGNILIIDSKQKNISSTAIRANLTKTKDFLPKQVFNYIKLHKIYE